MKENWDKLYQLSFSIRESYFEKWMKEFIETLTSFIEAIFTVTSDDKKQIIIQELNDIMDALANKDFVLLEDALRYGLLESVKEYCR